MDTLLHDKMVEAQAVCSVREKSVFVFMYRMGKDFWSALSSFDTFEHAQKATIPQCTAWRIVRVDHLPVDVEVGEV